MTENTTTTKDPIVTELFEAGAHYGYSRRYWHPLAASFIFGFKNHRAIIDLEKTVQSLSKAEEFITEIAATGGQVLWVGNKPEAREAIKAAAELTKMPFVAFKWIGGSFTNFSEIHQRVEKLKKIQAEEESGELEKYTKKERLEISRDKADLERYFGGIVNMDKLPKAIVVIDSKEEDIAVAEAIKKNIPVIALANIDCDIRAIDYPIVANDNQAASIKLIIDKLAEAFLVGAKKQAEGLMKEKVSSETDNQKE